jgi:cytochrome c-type biogenesis protein
MNLDLLGIFGAGLLTFVTPCVLPLVPIYLSAMIGTDFRKISSVQRGQLILRAGIFTLGFILVFTLLGLTASSIGAFLIAHKSLLQIIGAVIIFIFGLQYLGIIEIGFLNRIVRANDSKLQTRFGGINAFIMGIVFAAGWSPCAGPILGSVLTYTASTTSNPMVGSMYLATYGLGFALPLLLLAVFAEFGSRLLKRISSHLIKIERAIGILLIIVAGSLVFSATDDLNVASEPRDQIAQESITPTMVIFTSSNCVVCRRMEPILEGITKLCQGKGVKITDFDLAKSENRYLISKHRIVGTPTFVFLDKQGNEVSRLVGEQTEKTLKQALSALRGEPCPGIGKFDYIPMPIINTPVPNSACNTRDS